MIMIHIAIGTKAQFIKMAPLMRLLTERSIPFNLIDLGQHALITASLRREFGIKAPDVSLAAERNVSTVTSGLGWAMRLMVKGINAARLKREVFAGRSGVCLVHGDTMSTIIALYLARRAGIKVAHVEAGLRSYNLFEPFPEEILRILVMRFSHVLFTPSAWAYDNLKKMRLQHKAVLTEANTSQEVIRYSLGQDADLSLGCSRYALITVHRMENIFSVKRMRFVVDFARRISRRMPVVFVQHPPTINQLKKFKLDKELSSFANIHFFKIVSHASFVHLLAASEFVVTDGGSIQEESFYLDRPCFLLRHHTERREGLDQNVLLSRFSYPDSEFFLNNYNRFRRRGALDFDARPSEKIAGYLADNFKDEEKTIGHSYYDENIYAARHKVLSDFNSPFQRYRLKQVLNIYRPGKEDTVLDVGCGWGTFCFALAPFAASVTGLDFSPRSIETCNEIKKERRMSNLDFVCADAARSGLASGRYDVIICADLIEHLYPDTFEAVIDECYRLLKAGGKLVLWTPHRGHIFEIMKNNNIILKKDPTHVDYKSRDVIEKALSRRGFVIRKSYYVQSHLPVLSIFEKLLLGFVPWARRRIAVLAEKK